MILFLATSANHLRELRGERKRVIVKTFPSGEMRVVVPDDVGAERVVLIGSVLPDANSLFEILMAADLLKRRGAQVVLVLLYLAYARQDAPSETEAFSAGIVCRVLQEGGFERAYVVDAHSKNLSRFFKFENILPLGPFLDGLKRVENPVIVAPDKGGIERARAMARYMGGKETACIQKQRLGPGRVRSLRLTGDVKGRNAIIIDDIIDSGATLASAADLLHRHGTKSVHVAATHGVFSGDAVERLENSPITQVIVTNTIRPGTRTRSGKIKIIRIEPALNALLAPAKEIQP